MGKIWTRITPNTGTYAVKDKTKKKKVNSPSDENNTNQKKGSLLQDEDKKKKKKPMQRKNGNERIKKSLWLKKNVLYRQSTLHKNVATG